MQQEIRMFFPPRPRGAFCDPRFDEKASNCAARYHRSIPGYRETPLDSLPALARQLGLGSVFVKDESARFGLNAFKALGSSYCAARIIAEKLALPAGEISYDAIASPEGRAALGGAVLATATDGNHGRGVAWTAKMLGQKAVVYLPAGSARERVENICALGAEAIVTDWPYDETVRHAQRQADANGWLLLQDTAWPGYETYPLWIMQGYLTLAEEISRQMSGKPTHIFLQAGVGSMAAALAAYFAQSEWAKRAKIVLVEPTAVDCCLRTAQADDGRMHPVEGELHSMMAGLCCGTPSTLAMEILLKTADAYAAIPDLWAARAMRVLGNPLDGDPRIVSGESGASTMGLLLALACQESSAPLRDALGLDGDSRCLLISTEGDTDRVNYRKVVWDL